MMAFFRLILLLFLGSCTAVLADFLYQSGTISAFRCNENSTIPTAQMSANIDSLLSELAASTPKNGFSLATSGKGTDQVYGLGQCRAGVNGKDCTTCLHNATQAIQTVVCQNRTDVWMWYDDACYLRFNDSKFFGTFDASSFDSIYDSGHPQHPSAFKKQLDALISKVSSEATVPANEGVGKEKSFSVASNATIYALAQCSRDLSLQSCTECLNIPAGNLLKFCENEKTPGCQVASSSCYVHYEIFPFY